MKKLNYIILGLLSLLSANVSCDSPKEDNAIYNEPTSFVLNTPAYADAVYDLKNTSSLVLTCSQPDYGFAAAVDYTVQISVDGDWESDKVQTLSEVSNSAVITVDANELDVLICQALGVASEEEMPTEPIKLYVRVKAEIPPVEKGSELNSVIYSNTITLNRVMPYYALPDMELPTSMYMIGNFCGWDWSTAPKMIAVNGHPELFWVIRYVKAGEGFKFSSTPDWSGNQFGYDTSIVSIAHNVAGEVSADGDGNFVVTKGGWYIFGVATEIVGRSYKYTIDILPPDVYVYGNANGGTWDKSEDWKFDVIDDPDAEWPFVSPTVLATPGNDNDGCLRLCICPDEWSVGSVDWWATEFIFFDGNISYRADGGDQDRVGNPAGKVYLNFVTGKGKVE